MDVRHRALLHGYELVCRIRPIPDVVQMTLNDDGEVMA